MMILMIFYDFDKKSGANNRVSRSCSNKIVCVEVMPHFLQHCD